MKKLLIILLFCWSVAFGQSVPDHNHFTIGQVMVAVYGDSTAGRNTSTLFTDSDAAKFDAAYGSKTMSPQTINGFRNYGAAIIPTVITASITSITENSASGGGEVTSDGGSSITTYGICWSTSTNPTTADSKTSNSPGFVGTFTKYLTGLAESTFYYVRAYATNAIGTAYGSNETFTTLTVYHSAVKSGNFTYAGIAGACAPLGRESEACSLWGTGSVETYTVPAGTYTSTISQADADAQAQADVDANGQAYADANGYCIC